MKKTSDVWNELIGRPPAALTPTERVVERVNKFLFDCECGGWLYNVSPVAETGRRWSELRETADCVATIGSPAVAQMLREVAEIVETADVQNFGTWEEFLAEADPSRRLPDLERVICNEVGGLWEKLHEFTLQHFECERD